CSATNILMTCAASNESRSPCSRSLFKVATSILENFPGITYLELKNECSKINAECLRRQLLQCCRLKHGENRGFDADELLALTLPQYAGDGFTGCSGHACNLLVGQNHGVARSDLPLAHLPPVEQQIREASG